MLYMEEYVDSGFKRQNARAAAKVKEIEDLSPKRKTVKNTNITAIEAKRYERLKKEGHFGTGRNSKT